MSLTRPDVEQIAALSRLQLSSAELDALTGQLARIVTYVQQLRELDTRDVPPLAHALDLESVLADDALGSSLARDEALANAPKRDAECYRAPAMLGGDF